MKEIYFNRDISWLGFNHRVLKEAADADLPVMERLKFLSIFSSNLDEFYSIRIPILMALETMNRADETPTINSLIEKQMKEFGAIIQQDILPELRSKNVHLLYNEPIPEDLADELTDFFYSSVMGFLQPVIISRKTDPLVIENNKLHLLVNLTGPDSRDQLVVINVPTDFVSRFYFIDAAAEKHRTIIFLEDVIKANLQKLFADSKILGAYSIKITRNAELDLLGEFKGSLAEKLEKKLMLRAYGPPTRFLFEPGIPVWVLEELIKKLSLAHANLVEGGHYHNLKDLSSLPLPKNDFPFYEDWPAKNHLEIPPNRTIFEILEESDLLIHPPYQSFRPILRFFNEAAQDQDVREIYVTLYRVATESQIVNALISAAKNGKKVTVFVELKARFDEANNLRWSRKMKQAGIKIVYSPPELKVHSKIALIRKKTKKGWQHYALLATGNLNEITAKFYTDHVLLTSQSNLSRELDSLFQYLNKKEDSKKTRPPSFQHLLVSPFNLLESFIELIEREMDSASRGRPASITIKLNNLEERTLIRKLYEASLAGVRIRLIVRSVCCLVPGLQGMSENISVYRIVDRYLEHGRIFIFHNEGNPVLYLGSADWMNRNIYRRIEVCFPIYEYRMKETIMTMIDLQLADNVKAVKLDKNMENMAIELNGQSEHAERIQSQRKIYELL
jgi:polyphosphate kinase